MTHPRARGNEVERDARRRKVAGLLLAGVRNQKTIAAQLGVNQSTISRDIAALEATWQQEAAADIDAAKGLDLARADRLIAAHWNQALQGNTGHTDRVLSLMQYRARILGFESAQRHDHSVTVRHEDLIQEVATKFGITPADLIAALETGGE